MESFEDIFKELCSVLENGCIIEDISTEFDQLPFESKVTYVYELFRSENLLPVPKRGGLKSQKSADTYRKDGNKAFTNKKDEEALVCYTKSISHALNDSEELALSYANRSAVLYSLKRYTLCLEDISRASNQFYPKNLLYKLLERKGKCFLILKNIQLARTCFSEALIALNGSNLSETQRNRVEKSIRKCMDNCDKDENGCQSMSYPEIERKRFNLPILEKVNHEIPNASESVQLKYSDSMGRYIEAVRDINPGELIVVEDPYASVLLPEFYYTHCYHCFARNLALIPCFGCSKVMYCSDGCRLKSWKQNHRTECKILFPILALKFGKMELLAIRLLLIASNQGQTLDVLKKDISLYDYSDKRTKGFNSQCQYVSSEYSVVHNLEGNIEKRSVADLFKRCAMSAFLLNTLRTMEWFSVVCKETALINSNKKGFNTELTDLESFAGTLLLTYLCIIPCNAHEISETIEKAKPAASKISHTSLEIGASLYPMLSLINHSCDPNVVRHSYNDAVVLRAIQPIKANEQVYDNYGYHYATHCLRQRQVQLCLQYHFKCECEACQFDWPFYENLSRDNPQYLTQDEEILKQLKLSSKLFTTSLFKVIDSDIDGQLEILCSHLSILRKAVKKPWRQYSDCQEAIKQCLALQANHYCHQTDILL